MKNLNNKKQVQEFNRKYGISEKDIQECLPDNKTISISIDTLSTLLQRKTYNTTAETWIYFIGALYNAAVKKNKAKIKANPSLEFDIRLDVTDLLSEPDYFTIVEAKEAVHLTEFYEEVRSIDDRMYKVLLIYTVLTPDDKKLLFSYIEETYKELNTLDCSPDVKADIGKDGEMKEIKPYKVVYDTAVGKKTETKFKADPYLEYVIELDVTDLLNESDYLKKIETKISSLLNKLDDLELLKTNELLYLSKFYKEIRSIDDRMYRVLRVCSVLTPDDKKLLVSHIENTYKEMNTLDCLPDVEADIQKYREMKEINQYIIDDLMKEDIIPENIKRTRKYKEKYYRDSLKKSLIDEPPLIMSFEHAAGFLAGLKSTDWELLIKLKVIFSDRNKISQMSEFITNFIKDKKLSCSDGVAVFYATFN